MSDTYSTEEMAPGDATEPGEEGAASQQEVNYRAGTPIKNCGLCEHFAGVPGKAPDGCSVVDGDISPFGFCDIYLRQPNPFGDQHQYKMSGDQITPVKSTGLLNIGRKAYGG